MLQLSPNIVKAENEWDFYYRNSGCPPKLLPLHNPTPPLLIPSLSYPPVSDFYTAPLCLSDTHPVLHFIPSSKASEASASLLLLTALCFSSSLCFSEFASSHRPSSISFWSGLRRLSVSPTPSSCSFRVSASAEKKYMFSAFSLRE